MATMKSPQVTHHLNDDEPFRRRQEKVAQSVQCGEPKFLQQNKREGHRELLEIRRRYGLDKKVRTKGKSK
jgi:hypothetical protein